MNKEQKKQLKSWGIDPKTIKENKKTMKTFLWIILGIIIGVALVIVSVEFNVSSLIITNYNCVIGMQESYNFGMNGVLLKLTNESINCRQIPITYSNYSYTLIPIECLYLNNQEVNQNG